MCILYPLLVLFIKIYQSRASINDQIDPCSSCHRMSASSSANQANSAAFQTKFVDFEMNRLLWKLGLENRPEHASEEAIDSAMSMLRLLHLYDSHKQAHNHQVPLTDNMHNVTEPPLISDSNQAVSTELFVVARKREVKSPSSNEYQFHFDPHNWPAMMDIQSITLHLFMRQNNTDYNPILQSKYHIVNYEIMVTNTDTADTLTDQYPVDMDQSLTSLAVDLSNWANRLRSSNETILEVTCLNCSPTSPGWSSLNNESATLQVQFTPSLVSRSRRWNNSRQRCGQNSRSCCKRTVEINFEDIGWADWVLWPKSYQAGYCVGQCVLGTPNSASSDALKRQADYLKDQGRQFDPLLVPCCRPTHMEPLTIMHLTDNGTFLHSQIPELIVTSCGC